MRSVVAMLSGTGLVCRTQAELLYCHYQHRPLLKEPLCRPRDLPSSAEYVDLSLTIFVCLRSGDFENTTRLRFLNLSWNGLEKIDQLDTLTGGHDLSHNSLQNLSHQLYLFNRGISGD
ncbi:Leucine-rich repeat-containing protein 17 [Merluccius polli]|uniref:Leucine-rich repeat-containing protein 17 n=1 Tax=Merluccius polli TaxID=89951 RepID=A0AA47M560_MERPO|nr:Leucine-rich repeat-containing protein 17 [Merluccius polli]